MPVHRPLITEVIERTAQGMTRPYLCMADDGEAWYVKSAGAAWRSVVCEWIGGRLATAFGLPLPPISQPEVDEALAKTLHEQGDHDLAAGPAFGSQRVEHVRDFEPAFLDQCAQDFRRNLVAFDWWVRNADRTLGVLSGNPNLLWVSGEARPVVIDHNLAFDSDFDAAQFVQTHVFRADFLALRDDLVTRAEYEQRFAALLPLLDTFWAQCRTIGSTAKTASPGSRGTRSSRCWAACRTPISGPGLTATPPTMTNRQVALYTLVRLLPQADAGEFANIGVVLACPQQRRFEFRLVKRYTRVTRFFEEFSGDLFRRVRGEVQAELDHIRKTLLVGGADAKAITALMNDLARPRESLIRYAPVRTLLTADAEADLERLFRRYVQRDPQDVQQRREELVERAVRGVLLQQNLRGAFAADEVGTDDYHVRFPFVHERDGRPVAVIKPLDLTQDEPQKIYDHGGLWVQRIGRLQRMQILPEGLLIPVEAPPANDERRAKAFQEVAGELRALGAHVTRPDDAVEIGRFARRFAS